MGNMSYCRFQNTLPDLRDCHEALNEEQFFNLSEDEQAAAKQLIKRCVEIAEDFGDLAA